MKFKVWRPDAGETVSDAAEYEASDPRRAAEAAASSDHRRRDGWEWTWPVTYHAQDEHEQTVSVEVDREMEPVFYALRPRPVSP